MLWCSLPHGAHCLVCSGHSIVDHASSQLAASLSLSGAYNLTPDRVMLRANELDDFVPSVVRMQLTGAQLLLLTPSSLRLLGDFDKPSRKRLLEVGILCTSRG